MEEPRARRWCLAFLLLALLLAGLFLWSLNAGSLPLTPCEVWDILVRREGEYAAVIWKLRLPRTLAAALLGFPRLLILDEPTNGLDPAGIQEMRELIRSLPGRFGMTVVVSSHLLSEIDQMADHVGIIREGRLVFQDTLSALHARSCPRLALRTTDNAGAARLLGENRVPCTLEDGWLTLPLLSDADAASLSRFLASHRVDLLRMEERQKSLEDLFLELTGREESL